jgi:hypothetical protein
VFAVAEMHFWEAFADEPSTGPLRVKSYRVPEPERAEPGENRPSRFTTASENPRTLSTAFEACGCRSLN